MRTTLYLDFETSPILGEAWVVYEAEIFRIWRDVQIISVAWSWEGEDEVYAVSLPDFSGHKAGLLNINDKKLVKSFIPIFNQATSVVAHNGKSFDFKLWRTRLIVHGFDSHPNIKEYDTKLWARKFRFSNNKQDTISRQLGTQRKMVTPKDLHYDCIELNKPSAWKQMVAYNKQDVRGLKENAHRMAPFVTTGTLNANLVQGTTMSCPNELCGSSDMKREKLNRLVAGGWASQYQCRSCGRYAQGPKTPFKVLLK